MSELFGSQNQKERELHDLNLNMNELTMNVKRHSALGRVT